MLFWGKPICFGPKLLGSPPMVISFLFSFFLSFFLARSCGQTLPCFFLGWLWRFCLVGRLIFLVLCLCGPNRHCPCVSYLRPFAVRQPAAGPLLLLLLMLILPQTYSQSYTHPPWRLIHSTSPDQCTFLPFIIQTKACFFRLYSGAAIVTSYPTLPG